MKRLAFCLSALLAIVVALFLPAQLAAAPVRTQTAIDFVLAEQSGCSVTPESYLLVIVNASSVYDCDSTGGGTASAICICDGGSIRGAVVEDVESYVLITLAGQQAITASGAGNDVTLNAADDVILLPGDDFRVTPTAGSAIINAVGAGEDVSLVAADDVLLTPTDALTAAVGGAASITTTAGAIGLTAGGTTQDITLTSVDDVILVPADALTATVGGAAAVTTTAGAITLTAGGTTEDISLISVDQVVVDGAGGADELVIDDDTVTVGTAAAFIPGIASAPPVACAAGTKGAMYYDSDINKVCICNATNYVLMNDDTTTTGCS